MKLKVGGEMNDILVENIEKRYRYYLHRANELDGLSRKLYLAKVEAIQGLLRDIHFNKGELGGYYQKYIEDKGVKLE